MLDNLKIKYYALKSKQNCVIYKEMEDIDFKKLDTIAERFSSKNSVDRTTWNDLNMNKVFARINYTLTSTGEETLYRWLMNQMESKLHYSERVSRIDSYAKNYEEGLLEKSLSTVGYYRYDFNEMIKVGFVENNVVLLLFMIISAVNLMVGLYSIVTLTTGFIPIIMLLSIVNFFIHYKFIRDYGNQFETIRYLVKLSEFITGDEENLELLDPIIKNKAKQILNSMNVLSKRQNIILHTEGIDGVVDYINILFLTKEINVLLVARELNKKRDELTELYDLIGQIDATLSIIKFRETVDYYSTPQILNLKAKISVCEMYHVLVNNPVSNTVETEESIAITGSNMTGKSTFLRTLGVNTLLAQGICTSLSKKHIINFARVISSISLNDDITEQKSYFLREAEAIKRMIESVSRDNSPVIILIDEIFKGTNPVERLAASIEILNSLNAGNCNVMMATHDLPILSELKGYEYYYFKENVNKRILDCDYKLYEGIASTRNAVNILKSLEYPKSIIKQINARVKNY